MGRVPPSSLHLPAACPADHGPSGSLGPGLCPPSSLALAPSTCLTLHCASAWTPWAYFCLRSMSHAVPSAYNVPPQLFTALPPSLYSAFNSAPQKLSLLPRHHRITLFVTKNDLKCLCHFPHQTINSLRAETLSVLFITVSLGSRMRLAQSLLLKLHVDWLTVLLGSKLWPLTYVMDSKLPSVIPQKCSACGLPLTPWAFLPLLSSLLPRVRLPGHATPLTSQSTHAPHASGALQLLPSCPSPHLPPSLLLTQESSPLRAFSNYYAHYSYT